LFLLYNVTQVGTTLCRFLYKKTSLLFKTIKQFTVINSSFSCYDEESKEQVDEEVYKKEEGEEIDEEARIYEEVEQEQVTEVAATMKKNHTSK